MKTNRRDFIQIGAGAAAFAATGDILAGISKPKAKRIPTRMFWNWDHSTNWCENVPGSQTIGVGNAYTKAYGTDGAWFERDFRRVVNWCAAHDMQAICVAGLVRSRHGGLDPATKWCTYSAERGIDATRRLCGYAREKGVRVCIIGGAFAYGGAFYAGDHKYSLDRFLEANPDCIAKDIDGEDLYAEFLSHGGTKREPQGCPSSEKLKDFVLESYDWLFKAIPELGGIQMEAGDNGVCQCTRCKERRGRRAAQECMSLEDMAAIYPRLTDVIRARSGDALIICETYHHFLDKACGLFYEDPPGSDAAKLFAMPKDVCWQWKCDEKLDKDEWPEGAALPKPMQAFHNVMRSHAATQWWGGRDSFDVDKIRRKCYLSSLSGIDAVSMFGEVSPFHANAEFNYLALQYFADTPDASVADFAKDVMAPRLGGADRAADWLAWCRLEHDAAKIPYATEKIARIAADANDAEIRRRWLQLGSRLESFHWEWERNGHVLPVYASHAEPMTRKEKAKGADHL